MYLSLFLNSIIGKEHSLIGKEQSRKSLTGVICLDFTPVRNTGKTSYK